MAHKKKWFIAAALLAICIGAYLAIYAYINRIPRKIDFEYLGSSEYNPEYLYQEYRIKEGTPITFWDVEHSANHFMQSGEYNGFTPVTNIDFQRYSLIVSYGREIVNIEIISEYYGSLIPAITFTENHSGNTVFFYQIKGMPIYPLGKNYYIQQGSERVLIGDIYDINESAVKYPDGK